MSPRSAPPLVIHIAADLATLWDRHREGRGRSDRDERGLFQIRVLRKRLGHGELRDLGLPTDPFLTGTGSRKTTFKCLPQQRPRVLLWGVFPFIYLRPFLLNLPRGGGGHFFFSPSLKKLGSLFTTE